MLNPPGSAGARAVRATNRRKTPESTEDQLRQLQRTGSNKKCCDCTTKLPQCVNLTVGSFVCLACAGMHRELNMRVKGIGASTFSQEEVDRLRATSNDAVNQAYMARYNPNVERIQPPTNNFDQAQLRDWIKRKYRDKVWYSSEPQPTRVQIPPKQTTSPAPATVPSTPQDLLGFGSQAQAAQSASNQQWDAFGGNSTNNESNAFPVDFGSTQSKQQQQPPTQDSFANFQAQQQPPQPSGPQQQGFANFGLQQQPQQPVPQQQPGFASFGAPTQQQQPQQQQAFANFGAPTHQQHTQQQQTQQQGFANFGTQTHQHQPVPQHQQGFANFGATDQPGIQPQQQPQQQFGSLTQQPSPQQQNFANFSHQPQQGQFAAFGQQQPGIAQQAPPPQQQQQQPQHANPQQQGFTNFGGQQQNEMQQIPQQSFGQFQNVYPPQQNQFGAFGQPQQPGVPQEAPAPSQQQNGFGQNVQQTQPGNPSQPSQGVGDMPSKNPPLAVIGGMSVDDAFADFSIHANTSKSQPAASYTPIAAPSVKKGEDAKYAAGATAVYKNSTGVKEIIKILKVHLDDELVPFYTIQLADGREKQTDDGHLSDLVDSAEASEIKNLLMGLSSEQLQKVVAFIKDMKNGDNSSMPVPSMSAKAAPLELASSDPFSGMTPSPSVLAPSAPMPSKPPPIPPVSRSPLMPSPTMPSSNSPLPLQPPSQPQGSLSQSMGQMPTSAPQGMMGMQDAQSMIPSPTPTGQQLQNGKPGDLPSPPLYQQEGMPAEQQGYNQQQSMMPNPNQQQMQQLQNQQQYLQPQMGQMQQPPHMHVQLAQNQQQHYMPQQENTREQEKGNPFDMY